MYGSKDPDSYQNVTDPDTGNTGSNCTFFVHYQYISSDFFKVYHCIVNFVCLVLINCDHHLTVKEVAEELQSRVRYTLFFFR